MWPGNGERGYHAASSSGDPLSRIFILWSVFTEVSRTVERIADGMVDGIGSVRVKMDIRRVQYDLLVIPCRVVDKKRRTSTYGRAPLHNGSMPFNSDFYKTPSPRNRYLP